MNDYTGASFPVDRVRVTLPFADETQAGYSAINKHKGVDLAPFQGSEGENIYCPWRSKITGKGYHETAGNYVIAECSFPFDASLELLTGTVYTIKQNEIFTWHMYHFLDIAVKSAETIKEGLLLGSIGNTGKSTGPHVHFEVRVGDPSKRIVGNPLHLLVATIPGLKQQLEAKGVKV